MCIIEEIEKREYVDWDSILKIAIKVVGSTLVIVVIAVVGLFGMSKSKG